MFTRNALLKSTSTIALRRGGSQLKYYHDNSASCSSSAQTTATTMTSASMQSWLLENHGLAFVPISERSQRTLVAMTREVGMELDFGRSTRDMALGLRSSRPPDSVGSTPGKKEKRLDGKGKTPRRDQREEEEDVEISDAEWQIRTGRALFVLQETLPEFFKIGLVTDVDKATGAPVQQRTSSSVLPLSLGPSGNPLDFLQQNSHEHDTRGGGEESVDGGVESIYSPRVKLEYTPPTSLPPPFPRTLHVEGLPLYLASAAFMRHTMNALYSDLKVTLMKVAVNVPPSSSSPRKTTSNSSDGLTEEPQPRQPEKKGQLVREKSVIVRFMVTGNARVGGGESDWEIESTYIFSPISGLIHKQVVNSIHPAPHQAVYHSLSKLLGFSWSSGAENVGKGHAPGTMCKGPSSK